MVNTHEMVEANGRVVIVGAGLAGLFTALKLAPMPVTIISPVSLGKSSSSCWAQGGIAAAIGEGDHPDKHVADTVNVGAELVDADVARLVAYDASERIQDLLSYGVPFDRDLEGKLKLSREAAHSERRIVRVRGDMAGKAIMAALIETVRKTPSIEVLEGYRVKDLLINSDCVCGVYVDNDHSEDRQSHLLLANGVVLASGGIGGLYNVTTNPVTSCGEGIGMAARAGAVVADAEFVQFHPTAINVGLTPAPLATEALRGDGAKLVNQHGYRFMVDHHPDAELAPRDVVAYAVFQSLCDGDGAYLDCREAIGEKFPEKYPTVYEKCLSAAVNPVTDLIPISPAAHYHMGGLLTDCSGRTTLDGLWACGEVASTGTHGANRLASNSLLETVVFANRIAEDLMGQNFVSPRYSTRKKNVVSYSQTQNTDVQHALTQIKKVMSEHLGVVRDQDGLLTAYKTILELRDKRISSLALENMLITAQIITKAALLRKESRGAHRRNDFPDPRLEDAHRRFLKLDDFDILETKIFNKRFGDNNLDPMASK